MSKFFEEDVVAFRDDGSILGTVDRTWSTLDKEAADYIYSIYIHKDLSVERPTGHELKPAPGYVLIALNQDIDGYCLVPENLLHLADRSLAVGDTVKRTLSDVQSGTVISTSTTCGLIPVCSTAAYNTKHHLQPDDFSSLSKSQQEQISNLPEERRSSYIQASGQQLTYCNEHREGDFVICRGWVGRVIEVYNEVTVRLTNGSVVVVEDPDELEEPYWIPGSASHELAQRLHNLGFRRYVDSPSKKPQFQPLESPCPGQRVRTKKGNLRRGRWIFGAYDPTIIPDGLIANVRCIGLKVRWLYDFNSQPKPLDRLTTDELNSGEVILYDRSRLPNYQPDHYLPNASHSQDIGLGVRVRFRQPAETETKDGDNLMDIDNECSSAPPVHSPSSLNGTFHPIPREATQGFDMNVLRVTSMSTKVRVQWQDCSITEEASVQLLPYLTPDDNEVWPGDRVSRKSKEELVKLGDIQMLRAHEIGVVQSVDAIRRMATVRWYDHKVMDMNEEIAPYALPVQHGELNQQTIELPLYDIAAHTSLRKNVGDMVAIPKDPYNNLAIEIYQSRYYHGSGLDGIGWFGEITETCLDGDVTVRLGAASQVLDIKIDGDRVLVVVSADDDHESDSTDDESTDDSSSESNADQTPLDVTIEYEGGGGVKQEDQGDEMWTTEDEGDHESSTSLPQAPDYSSSSSPSDTVNKAIECASTNSKAPLPFLILDCPPSFNHHFVDEPRDMTAKFMRRVSKENKILQSSLPEGVFVRTWERRLDLLRILMVGPEGTPYEFAPFVFDLRYDASFPNSPPVVFFHSWTGKDTRINPNLYENGTVCLSLLGTWNGKENEKWVPETSTTLQVIMSLMGLVLVKEPYYSKLMLFFLYSFESISRSSNSLLL